MPDHRYRMPIKIALRNGRWSAGFLAVLPPLMLIGCAGPILSDAQPMPASVPEKSLTLAPEGGDARPPIVAALGNQGWQLTEQANTILYIAFSVRPANLTISSNDRLGEPKPPLWACKAHTATLQLEVVERNDGRVIASSSVARNWCGSASAAKVSQLAGIAVDRLLAKTGP